MPSSAKRGPDSERVTIDDYQSTPSDYLVYLCHLATYEFARPHVRERRVLDFGCGTGYGAHTLAADCESIVGVDISDVAIEYARHTYRAPNLTYERIDKVQDAPLPFPDGTFGAVLSFQVVEHVDDVDRYLSEIERVLAPGGLFACATPDRRTRLFPQQRPWNVYHRHEYEPRELAALLRTRFASIDLYGMSADAELLAPELRRYRRTRLATLPLTFPGVPEGWRRAGLMALKRLQRRRSPSGSGAAVPTHLDHTAVRIAPGAEPSLNIVVLARR